MDSARVWVHTPGQRGPTSVALEGDRLLVGRGDHCDVRLEDEVVSSDHLEITRHGTSYRATDLGSRNGTLLNGQKLTESTKLRTKDVLSVGAFRLELDLPRRTETIPAEGLDLKLDPNEVDVAAALVAPYREAGSFAAQPATRKQIAEQLHISESSVKRRLDGLALKLGVPAEAKRDRPRHIADRVLALGIDRLK